MSEARLGDATITSTVLAAFDDARIGIAVILNRNGQLEWIAANQFHATRLGYTVAELVALHPLAIVAPPDVDSTHRLVQRVSEGEKPPVFIEMNMRHRDGRAVPSEVATHSVPTADGLLAVHVIRDLGVGSSPSWLESDRLTVVGALAAGIAHEINNPLTYVLLHLRSLRRVIEDCAPDRGAEAARLIDEAYAGADRIRAIVRAVNALAAPPGPDDVEVDLGAVVQSALRLVRPELESRARVVVQLFPVAPVRGDEPRLGQVVLSMMLFAAAGFQGDDPALNRVVLAVEMRDREVTFEVTDNGRDLSPSELDRADEIVRCAGDARGHGLAVARSIAMAAGGRLAIAQRPGGGLRTTLSLPTVAIGGAGG